MGAAHLQLLQHPHSHDPAHATTVHGQNAQPAPRAKRWLAQAAVHLPPARAPQSAGQPAGHPGTLGTGEAGCVLHTSAFSPRMASARTALSATLSTAGGGWGSQGSRGSSERADPGRPEPFRQRGRAAASGLTLGVSRGRRRGVDRPLDARLASSLSIPAHCTILGRLSSQKARLPSVRSASACVTRGQGRGGNSAPAAQQNTAAAEPAVAATTLRIVCHQMPLAMIKTSAGSWALPLLLLRPALPSLGARGGPGSSAGALRAPAPPWYHAG